MTARLQNKLVCHEERDWELNQLLIKAKKGSFWHWRRTYVLKDEDERIYTISLNIFERIYGNVAGSGIEKYFKKIFSNRKITGFVLDKDIKLLIYNTSSSNGSESGQSPLDKIYQRVESEAPLWRGNKKICLQTPNEFLNGRRERKEWWGRFAKYIGSTGLNTQLEKAIQGNIGVALDIGCGKSASAMYLLKKDWRVICVDYSQKALDAMKEEANKTHAQWLKTDQLQLICCPIEEYECPEKVDLVLASSALPYINPQKLKTVMEKIYQYLNPNGYFIGNFFAAKRVGSLMDITREIGAWFVEDEESVGYLLAGHGYKVIECDYGDDQHPHSVIFIGQKPRLENYV